MYKGWIAIHRKILDHWIFKEKPYSKGQAFVTMLLEVNHTDAKVLIQNELIECKRGQSLNSLKTWALLFGWSIQKVRTFFNLLKKDSIIELEGLHKTTRLTICNYDSYQPDQHTNNTQTTDSQHTDNTQTTTNNNDKKNKNEKKSKYGTHKNVLLTERQYENLKKDFGDKFDYWLLTFSEGIKIKNYGYKDHNLAIRKWKRNADEKNPNKKVMEC